MAIKQFTIGTSKTINLCNFGSHRVEASIVWEVTEDAGEFVPPIQEQMKMAQEELRALREKTYKAQRKDKPARG